MEKTITTQLTDCIEKAFCFGNDKKNCSQRIIVYPCGDIGIRLIGIMKDIYSIEPALMIDNNKCKYSDKVHDLSYLNEIDANEYVLILTSINKPIYEELKSLVKNFFPSDRIIELEMMHKKENDSLHTKDLEPVTHTKCGKYSHGPLCNHWLVEEVGAFCSFAPGTDAVGNHTTEYITTSPFVFFDTRVSPILGKYESQKNCNFYFEGVEPHANHIKLGRSIIGNDVWLGRNVLITNGVNIGNGVIAGAGSVITKDIPDYAVVVGGPARIIRYRYSPDVIKALNEICWWDWPDEIIRERFEDFYLSGEEFVQKYYRS